MADVASASQRTKREVPMLRRREFLKTAGNVAGAILAPRHMIASAFSENNSIATFASASMELQLSTAAPEFLSFNVDGLGLGKRGANIVDPIGIGSGYNVRSFTSQERSTSHIGAARTV